MKRNQKIVIIGGGVIGLTCAWRLSKFGHRVTVIDQQEMGKEASWAAAGMIPPGRIKILGGTSLDLLRNHTAARFPELSAEILSATGIDNGYRRCGAIELFDEEPFDLVKRWRSQQIMFERLDDAQVQELVPTLQIGSKIAFHFPDFAQVRTPRHLQALIALCKKQTVELRPQVGFQSWIIEQEQVRGIVTTEGPIEADSFLVTAGAWAERMLQPLGCNTHVLPVKGEMLLYKPEQINLKPIIISEKRYIVPRDDGRILVGSTEEASPDFDKRITLEAESSLSKFASDLLPALAQTPIEKAWAGLRPGNHDGYPTIDRVPGYPNVIAAVGHFRAGVQQSIGTACYINGWLKSKSPGNPDFAFNRQPHPTTERPLFQS